MGKNMTQCFGTFHNAIDAVVAKLILNFTLLYLGIHPILDILILTLLSDVFVSFYRHGEARGFQSFLLLALLWLFITGCIQVVEFDWNLILVYPLWRRNILEYWEVSKGLSMCWNWAMQEGNFVEYWKISQHLSICCCMLAAISGWGTCWLVSMDLATPKQWKAWWCSLPGGCSNLEDWYGCPWVNQSHVTGWWVTSEEGCKLIIISHIFFFSKIMY